MDNKNTYRSLESDKIKKVQTEVSELKEVIINNIDKVIERGEKIEVTSEKAENLNRGAGRFKDGARNLRRKLWWKNVRYGCAIVFIIVGIITILALIIWGATKPK